MTSRSTSAAIPATTRSQSRTAGPDAGDAAERQRSGLLPRRGGRLRRRTGCGVPFLDALEVGTAIAEGAFEQFSFFRLPVTSTHVSFLSLARLPDAPWI